MSPCAGGYAPCGVIAGVLPDGRRYLIRGAHEKHCHVQVGLCTFVLHAV